MSVQVFLQGKLVGVEDFLRSDAPFLAERWQWITLLGEVLPRALLAELGLSKMLLGTSGGEQFLLVLPDESRPEAERFLAAASSQIKELSGGRLRLLNAFTENLGDWSVVRKRLNEDLRAQIETTAAAGETVYFEPMDAVEPPEKAGYFENQSGLQLREAATVGWSPESPGRIVIGGGKHTWSLTDSTDSISLARHVAPSEDGRTAATSSVLARRASGRPLWGVLRGDVDHFGVRIRRAQTIEEHIQLSVQYKQFFAGELEVVCSLPEFWRKVTILFSGGDDFAVYGAWDALIPLAREIQRLFQRFSEENLKDFPGPEGKTITMALELRDEDGDLGAAYNEAGRKLEIAKSTNKDCFHLLGRTLEWKQLADAESLKSLMTRLVTEYGLEPQSLRELGGIYRETQGSRARADRPWRFHRRLNRVLSGPRDRDYQKLRNSLVTNMIGNNPARVKLRPAGRVALEWARLLTEV